MLQADNRHACQQHNSVAGNSGIARESHNGLRVQADPASDTLELLDSYCALKKNCKKHTRLLHSSALLMEGTPGWSEAAESAMELKLAAADKSLPHILQWPESGYCPVLPSTQTGTHCLVSHSSGLSALLMFARQYR